MVALDTKNNKYLIAIYAVLAILTVIYAYFNCIGINTWYDEGFSIHIINHSYAEIWNITATDVHPPLYYWLLKLHTSIFGDSIIAMRWLSAIPIFLTVLLAIWKVRTLWNNRTAIFFILLMLAHYKMQAPISDIRMYSWTMFFVFLAYVGSYAFYKKYSLSNLLLVIVGTVGAAYTHNYSLLAVAFIGLYFIGLSFYKKKNKTAYYFIATATISALLFIPWLIVLLGQVAQVNEGYWIQGIAYNEFVQFFNPFSRYMAIGLVLLVLFALRDVLIKDRAKYKERLLQVISLLIIASLPLIVGLVYSYIVHPILIPRYIYCTLLLYFLAIAQFMGMANLRNRVNQIIFIIFFLALGFTSVRALSEKVDNIAEEDREVNAMMDYINENIDDSTAFLYNSSYRLDLPAWIDRYPDYPHVARYVKLPVTAQIMDLMPYDSIGDMSEVDAAHKKLIIIGLDGMGLLYNKVFIREDSAVITKQYSILDRFKYNKHTIHILKRKDNE